MNKIKVMTIAGTRPEGIKMAPLIKELNKREEIEHIFCSTGQHKEMLNQVLDIFDIKPDIDLNIFEKGQSLSQVTCRSLLGLEEVLKDYKPDLVLVQGDTTTVFSGALAAFYQKIDIGHVEAGLRSHDMFSPYPEEINRKLTGILTKFCFAVTDTNVQNLKNEGIEDKKIYKVGNTVIDAVKIIADNSYKFECEELNKLNFEEQKVILLTCHRRENLGQYMDQIFSGIRKVADANKDAVVVFPMHLNPLVREQAKKHLDGNARIKLIEPLNYRDVVNLESKCYMIMTDSGGLQEEGPAFGKPVLVLRKETERPEGIEVGTAKLTGVLEGNVIKDMETLLNNKIEYNKMAKAVNPYGDGNTSKKIVDIIIENYKK